jgi:hypothetical protein
MPQGLQVFDAQGRVVVDLADRVGRIVAVFPTGTEDGSRVVGGLDGGIPFMVVQGMGLSIQAYTPTVQLSGNTVSWVFDQVTVIERTSVNVFVGVY